MQDCRDKALRRFVQKAKSYIIDSFLDSFATVLFFCDRHMAL